MSKPDAKDYGIVTVSIDLLVHREHPIYKKRRMRKADTLENTMTLLSGLRKHDDADILGAAVNRRSVYRYWRMPEWKHAWTTRFKQNRLLAHLFPTLTYEEWSKSRSEGYTPSAASATPAAEPVSISVA